MAFGEALHKRPSVLAIAGSLRRGSYNRNMLEFARRRSTDLNISIFDLNQIPLFNEDVEANGIPVHVSDLWRAARDADAILIATPEYNQSIPGVLKNAIDWMSRSEPSVLGSKPVAIAGVTVGAWGTRHAQAVLRHCLTACGASVMPVPQAYFRSAADAFDADGQLQGREALTTLDALLSRFREWIQRVGTNE